MNDLTGMSFGRLTVIKRCGTAKNGAALWICECSCGNTKIVTGGNLVSGSTESCGCLKLDVIKSRNTKHNLSKHRIHGIWRGIKNRCNNEKCAAYKYYGGRGIKICNEWNEDFLSFYLWSMNNGYSEDKSIDRIDVNGNYDPDNCRWATNEEQQNNKRNSAYIVAFGKKKTLKQWSDYSGINRKTISDRIRKYGWKPEDAIQKEPMKTYDHRRNKKELLNIQ